MVEEVDVVLGYLGNLLDFFIFKESNCGFGGFIVEDVWNCLIIFVFRVVMYIV